ncbi:hypothetical protein PQO01_15215 [Lentisphaera marina]|uniref:GH36-type glycosyl hydrolase domain-containing protein n=1 Tax=Lentisphaera marina TaxID=1111041 RepID=UPI0023651959|nr:hypothetical protein [Lentisphaera marina]MDD7986299.1 hypothetical protein [Lentisphaera marina]
MKDIIYKYENTLGFKEFRNNTGMHFRILQDGTPYSIENDNVLVNLFMGNIFDEAVSNIYLRVFKNGEILSTPMVSKNSKFAIATDDRAYVLKGSFQDIDYSLTFRLAENTGTWFWTAEAENTGSDLEVDFIYVQDAAVAAKGAPLNNEGYVSHYIDQSVLGDKATGYVLCARQNLKQHTGFPFLMSGALDGAEGFITDGIDFFGLNYKENAEIAALKDDTIRSIRRQGEFSCHVLQSKRVALASGAKAEKTFFAFFEVNHEATSSDADLEKVELAKSEFAALPAISLPEPQTTGYNNLFGEGKFFQTEDLNDAELEKYFAGEKRNLEEIEGKTAAFFYGDDSKHVVLKHKEVHCERPHGHIVRSGEDLFPSDEAIASTCWMGGVFNSQVTFGNTSFNKAIGIVRGWVNFQRASGQRIFVRDGDKIEQLRLPSAFEISLNACRWIYKGAEETIIVTTQCAISDAVLVTNIEVESGKELEFIVTNNIIMGVNEYANETVGRVDDKRFTFFPGHDYFGKNKYPNSRFDLSIKEGHAAATLSGDEVLFLDGENKNYPYATIKTAATGKFELVLTGTITDDVKAEANAKKYTAADFDTSVFKVEADAYWRSLNNNAKCSGIENNSVSKLSEIIPWLQHNAMIHYTKPYGLEQYSGAAWGSRDVCQGPVELLLAFGKTEPVKKVVLEVYKHQYEQNGEWPQWFMFDKFYDIQQAHAHGDIIVWPLKAVCDYVEYSNDVSILDEKIPYTNIEGFEFTDKEETLFDHINKELDHIRNAFVGDTKLISYGDGDWNDSLQPHNPEMKEKLVSVWTVELLYQTLTRYQVVCEKAGKTELAAELKATCEQMKVDFNKYLVKDELTAGFAFFNSEDDVDLLLHPTDTKTGVKYRLLPAIRGIISEIFEPEQAEAHYQMIQDKLLFADGVHLMDPPPQYTGGISKNFQRAETATFVGREIGNHYVHAHLRYMEAMAKLGKAEELLTAMEVVNPVNIQDSFESAEIRQSNCYFSSSDADYNDRYEAQDTVEDLRAGKVKSKGGWRIYSSGPGIYVNVLITRVLGIRRFYEDFVIDPVLPENLDGLNFNFDIDGKPVVFKYNKSADKKVVLNGKELELNTSNDNPYRDGGLKTKWTTFQSLLKGDNNLVEIYS